MQIIRLELDQLKYFSDMDPFMLSERLNFDNYFAVGAFAHNKKKDVDIPMGLMICSVNVQGMVIEWLCVGEKFRQCGVGEKLLVEAYNLAINLGTGKLFAYVNGYSDIFVNACDHYFKDRLFTEEVVAPGEWHSTIGDLNVGLQKNNGGGVAVPFSKIPKDSLEKNFLDFMKLDNTVFTYPFDHNNEDIDKKCSFLWMKDKEVKGGIIARKAGGALYPIAFSAHDIDEGKKILGEWKSLIEKSYEDTTTVRFLLRQEPQGYDWYLYPEDTVDYEMLKKLLNEVFNNNNYPGKYLVASIYEFIEQLDEEPKLFEWDDLAYEVLEEVKQG
ncbi:hypothetical protein SAMN05216351_101300 [Pseudobutyrivibrio sp. JW11]|uniref:hypothetical protein n=1 Tax=Pseudobutyrivibrio sp. JW11 TaxID=1855302 RepID=UPI0008ECCE1B|nr:hypothetical protein [Pseudobutyrivibrio sp. JW11]SFN82913.1 hypothetical protein SAMN05216351_101300 [Pseudobutyrivibrio sp. JW11]